MYQFWRQKFICGTVGPIRDPRNCRQFPLPDRDSNSGLAARFRIVDSRPPPYCSRRSTDPNCIGWGVVQPPSYRSNIGHCRGLERRDCQLSERCRDSTDVERVPWKSRLGHATKIFNAHTHIYIFVHKITIYNRRRINEVCELTVHRRIQANHRQQHQK